MGESIPKWSRNTTLSGALFSVELDVLSYDWISGKARSELPWIGTINLFFNDITSGRNTVANVPGDSLWCLGILIAVLVSIPLGMDIYSYYKEKKSKKKQKF